MAKHHRKFYERDYAKHIGATILLFFEFCALAFMSCGIPLGVLRKRGDSKECHTLWGIRPNCWKAEYVWRIESETCADRLHRWQAAEAFSIVAVFAILFVLGGAYYQLSGSNVKVFTILMSIFTIASTTVPWAVVTAFYFTDFCGEKTLTKEGQKYGSGYILMVVSFACQATGLLAFIFLEP